MKKSVLGVGKFKIFRRAVAGLSSLLIMMAMGTAAWARVAGPCVNCHTMHNTQNGLSVIDDDITLQDALVNNNCVGCHSNDAETIKDLGDGTRIPIVYTTNAPDLEPGKPTSMLAGGNFHWVKNDDTKGHNVYGIAGVDSLLSTAPGTTVGTACYNCHSTLATSNSGCRGCHLPAHHANDSAIVVDGGHGAYRFLGDVMALQFSVLSGSGVKGIEDPDWEQTAASSDHNVYSGTAIVYTNPGASSSYIKNSAIGEVCVGCHGNYHHKINTVQRDLSGVWIRHPSDVVLPNEGEFAGYKKYNPLAPVAKQNITSSMKNSSTVTPGADIVTCISCHRPHGSPYPDMLRWDYDTCFAGTANDECGCYACHTAKD